MEERNFTLNELMEMESPVINSAEELGIYEQWCTTCQRCTVHEVLDLEDAIITVCQSDNHAVPGM